MKVSRHKTKCMCANQREKKEKKVQHARRKGREIR